MKTLEEEIIDFCEKTDKDIGEYWSNDYYELPLQIERFVKESKWVQAEKIRAQIEVLNAIRGEFNTDNRFYIDDKIEQLEQQLKKL